MSEGRSARIAAVIGIVMLVCASAHAVPTPFSVSFGPATSDVGGYDFLFNLTVDPNIVGDATLTLTLDGDFNAGYENADIYVDLYLLGTVVDGDTSNDPFNFSNNDDPDSGSHDGNPFTGSATIANATIAPYLADGALTLGVNTSRGVNFDTTHVSGTLSYNTEQTVPDPGSTLLLLGCGLAGLMGLRRKSKS